MFYCESCLGRNKPPPSASVRREKCEICDNLGTCYDIATCQVKRCRNPSLKGRILCEPHAFPAEQTKSNRRKAVEAQKRKGLQ